MVLLHSDFFPTHYMPLMSSVTVCLRSFVLKDLDAENPLATQDVAVPISRLAECIDETKKELDASFLHCPIVGHVGDGNFHVCICFDPNSEEESNEAKRLNRAMVFVSLPHFVRYHFVYSYHAKARFPT